jgi:hypothetical protein
VVVDATALGGSTLTLTGSRPETVNNFSSGTINATGLSGALSVTTGAAAALSIATGASTSSIINASAMTSSETLTLTGAHAATVSVGGDLVARSDTGALNVTAAGASSHMLQTGGGADTISASVGNNTVEGGGAGDNINVLGHSAPDTFVYAATDDSLNTAAGHDTIVGFAASSDLLDFSALHTGNPLLHVGGQVASGSMIAANTIDWVNLGGSTMVYANDTNAALASNSASLMEIALNGTASLMASNIKTT